MSKRDFKLHCSWEGKELAVSFEKMRKSPPPLDAFSSPTDPAVGLPHGDTATSRRGFGLTTPLILSDDELTIEHEDLRSPNTLKAFFRRHWSDQRHGLTVYTDDSEFEALLMLLAGETTLKLDESEDP